MRKLFFFAAAAGVLGMTACQKAETPAGVSGEVDVTVSTSLPAEMLQTRAAGDGSEIDRCIMQIYLDGKLYGEHQYAEVKGLKATFSARLVAGETYDLVFWADKSGNELTDDLHYSTSDFEHVSFAGDYSGNDETRDAFFGSTEIVADKSQAVDVELRRPFGQLNVKTLDLAEVRASAPTLEPKKVKIAFKNIPTEINLLTGELSSTTQAVAYVDAAELAGTDGELTVDYVFAPKAEGEQYLTDFTMSFLDEAGTTSVASDYEFSNIPVQRNYRTNVSGYLLTKKTDVNVEVVPDFDGDIDYFEGENVSSSEEFLNAIKSGESMKLSENISFDTPKAQIRISDGEEISIDLNGYTLSFQDGVAINAENGSLTFENGTVEAKGFDNPAETIFNAGSNGTVILDGVTVNTDGTGIGPNSGVTNSTVIVRNSTLNCGAYAVATNASSSVDDVTITLENSILNSATAVCINIPCDVTIDGCTITGNTQGMMLRGGNATIKDSRLTLSTDGAYTSREDAESFANYFNSSNWGGGNMVNIAALTVGNKGGNAYQYPTVLDLQNTIIEVTGEYSDIFPSMYVYANQGEGLGVTITYDEKTTFSSEPVYGSENITVNE